MKRISLRAAALVISAAFFQFGCVSGGKVATTQPVDVDMLSGQIVAKITPVIKAEVTANVQGIGYTSYFGVGPSLIVGAALVLTLWLSHRREMKRLEKRD